MASNPINDHCFESTSPAVTSSGCHREPKIGPDGNLDDAVAIIGFDFIFPGNAICEDSFWSMLVEGHVDEPHIPRERFTSTAFPKGTPPVGAHFINDDIVTFDAPFFSITRAEAEAMDPQQRRLLETTYRALENSGTTMQGIRGSDTSVHIGCFTNDYNLIQTKDPELIPKYHATGSSAAVLANRISWYFDLRGPSVTVDTACSSSLVALDQACQMLRSNQANMGIVGGCNFIFTPEFLSIVDRMSFLSPSGRCHSFDSRASGYTRSEGIGTLVLKRLSKAIEDGDSIRAVIRATGVNQDGRTMGLTQPSTVAQEALLKKTYADFGLDMSKTRFVEAHGTGTKIGDLSEARALQKSFEGVRGERDPIIIGATKANIGHMEAASGIAGIIKTILVLEKGVIPPIADLRTLNPALDASNLHFPTSTQHWPVPGLRRASVQSFGFGGTNAHAVLDDAFHALKALEPRRNNQSFFVGGSELPRDFEDLCKDSQPQKLLVWSAPDSSALLRVLDAYSFHFKQTDFEGYTEGEYLQNLAHTLGRRRSEYSQKAFAVLTASQLEALQTHVTKPSASPIQDHSLLLVFTGQGAQWKGMGNQLLTYPVFQQSIARWNRYLHEMGCKWSLLEHFQMCDLVPQIDGSAEVSQSACTALQIALVDLLHSVSTSPKIVIGHSSGEIAAAYCIGALTSQSAMKLAYHRGRLSDQVARDTALPCTMMAVGLSKERVRPYLDKLAAKKGQHDVSTACINSPVSITLSGPQAQLDDVRKALEFDGIFARLLKVPVAYHSSQMRGITSSYITAIRSLECPEPDPRRSNIVMISTVTGAEITRQELLQPDYWASNLASPVQFSYALTAALTSYTCHSILEVGPHSALQGPIKESIKDVGFVSACYYLTLLSRFRPASLTFLNAIGELYCRGHPINIALANNQRAQSHLRPLTKLPPYPFDHSKRYWHESRISHSLRFRSHSSHALLGTRTADWNSLEPRWRNVLSTADLPFLEDHGIGETLIYPAAGMISMVVEGAGQMFEDAKVAVKGFELRNAEFMSALSLERDGKIEVETRLRTLQGRQSSRLVDRGYDFRIYSVRDQHWTLHCQGIIYGMVSEMLPTRSVPRECEYPKDGTGTLLNTNEVYDLLTRSGYHYGPSFRLLTRLHREGNQTFATLTAPTTQICERLSIQDPHIIHPAALDAVLQLGLIGVSSGEERRIPTILPTRIRSLKIVSSGLNICSDVCTIELSSNSRINDVGKLLCSANAYGLLSGKRLLNLQIAGFEGTAISSTDKDIQESSKAMCFQISWKPDLDTLSSGEILDLCWSGSSQESEKELISFERDCTVLIFHAIQKTLEAMENGSLQLDPSRAYLRKYHSWMKEQVHAFHSGAYSEIHSRYYDITRDARKLDQVKRAALEDKRWRLYTTVAESLAKILVGSEDPLQILFGRNLATDFYNESNRYSSCAPALKKYVELLSHKNPAMRILEVGAGTGGATRLALEAITSGARAGLGERYSCYDFTDVSPSLIASAKEEFGGSYPRMRFFTYDVEKLPIAQEANVASYDLVIAASVLHATADIRNTLRNVRSQLKPGGKLLLWEGVKPQHVRMSFVFGLLPGWHLSIEDFRQFSPCLSSSTWHTLLSEEGFSGVDVEFRDFSQEESHETSILVATATEESPSVSVSLGVDRLFIFGDLYDPTEMALCNELRKSFYESLGIGCTLAPFGALSGSSFAIESAILLPRVTASLLPARSSEEFLSMQGLLVRASVLLWVSESSDPRQSIIDGLSRTLRSERNDLRMTTISLQQSSTSVSHQAQLIDKAFCQMSTSDDYEPEYREKNGTLEVNRILQYPSLSESVIESSSHATVHAGINLSRHLESDEVEISVHSSNSSHYCSGWITRLGTNCHDLDVGDSVAAITPRFSGNLAVAQSHLIMPLPFKVSSARTASLLLPFGAAYHALVDVARITSSETVLININHTETRSSAIQIALHLGANVFVAVDPSTDRNAITSQFDLAFDHVLAYDGDALSTSIYQQMAHTGIDVVISDTSHLAIPRIIECGAPYSQFIFIRSHQDLFDDAIGTLPSGTTKYARVDLLTMAEAHPKILSRIMRKAIDVMLDLTLSPDDLDEDSPLSGSRRPKFSLAIDATYVIAGGLGGIGQSVARWMVSKGAKHLLLLNRSGAKDATAIEFIKELTDAGVHVSAPRCDISKAEELSEVLRPYGTVKPAIRGCVQASMSLKDAIFQNMTVDDFNAPLHSKVSGTWNLHTQLPASLSFFLLFSSVAGIFGSGGQANYAAGNTYQDALAHHLFGTGQRVVSIDLGMMLMQGYLSRNPTTLEKFVKPNGLTPMNESVLFALLEHFCNPTHELSEADAQIITGLGSAAAVREKGLPVPWWMGQPLFRSLHQSTTRTDVNSSPGPQRSTSTSSTVALSEEMKTAQSKAQCVTVVVKALLRYLHRITPDTVSEDPEEAGESLKVPLYMLGVDSLVAMELRNFLSREIKAEVSAFELLGEMGIEKLASTAVDKSALFAG